MLFTESTDPSGTSLIGRGVLCLRRGREKKRYIKIEYVIIRKENLHSAIIKILMHIYTHAAARERWFR